MDLGDLLGALETISHKIEAFQEGIACPSESSSWLNSQVQTLDHGLLRIQHWLQSTDTANRQPLYAALHDAFETLEALVGHLQADAKPLSAAGSNSSASPTRAGNDSQSLLERQSLLLKDCVALTDFTAAVCHSAEGNASDHEIRELAVGSKVLRETLTCSKRESQRLWSGQRSDSEQYISPSYDSFIDAVLVIDEDASRNSSSDSTLKRASMASSLVTDFSAVIARASGISAFSDELHLPDTHNAQPASAPSTPPPRSSLDHQQSAASQNMPVIVPYRRASDMNMANTRLRVSSETHSNARPFAFPSAQHIDQLLKRKPVALQKQHGSSSMLSLSSGSSLSAAEKAINIASDMTAQSPVAGKFTARGDNSLDMHTFSRRATINSFRTSVTYDKYQDSPPPYILPAWQGEMQPSARAVVAPPPASGPTDTAPKRRETLSNDRTPFIVNLVRENQIDALRNMPREGLSLDEADPATGRTALMESILLRQPNAACILIQSGSGLQTKDPQGNTALHYAAAQGDALICQTLLDAGAQLNDWNKQGMTPLQVAAGRGHTETVVCLLENHGRVKADDPARLKGFFEAAKSGNVSTTQAFLAAGVRPKKIKESWKLTAYAAQSGSIAMLNFMLAERLSLKDRSPDGWTALHFAARHGHPWMVEKLLDSRLPWRAQTKKAGDTALHLAIAAGHTSTAEFLMLHKDANVNIADAEGQEPIHHAVRSGDLGLTTALLKQGAKLSTANKYGWKPMHIATAYGHVALVADMLTRGVSIEDKLGAPAFKASKHTHEAARKGFWAETCWPHAGARPLQLALEFGHDDVASILLQGGAKLGEPDAEGWHALHYAAFHCRLAAVGWLLAKGASPHATTGDGHTPLSLGFREPGLPAASAAAEHDKLQIVALLQAAMDSRKKSKFRQLTTSLRSAAGGARSKSAAERNKVWHTAELAAALFRDTGVRGDDDDEEGQSEAEGDDDGEAGLSATRSRSSNLLESEDGRDERGVHPALRQVSKSQPSQLP